MKKLLFGPLFLAVSFLAISGCKVVKVENGQVPEEYMNEAKKLEGTYVGQFEGHEGEIQIRFNGNAPEVSFHGLRDDDLIPGCGTSVGKLREITVKGNEGDYRMGQAIFNFDKGVCRQFQGNTISLDFSKDQRKFSMNFLVRTEYRQECNWGPYPPAYGGRYGGAYGGYYGAGVGAYPICTDREYGIYMNGSFAHK